MDKATHNKIASFIWGIADDVLRTLKEISADILAIDRNAEGLLDDLLQVGAK
ncbi:MAG: hypothetical protein ACFB13_02230 [Kiloniellaceae bacterium]